MAWTGPRTWVTSETVSAAAMNTHVRDNLLETQPATVTGVGDLTYADGANSIVRLAVGSDPSFLASDGTNPVWRTIDMDTDYSGGSSSGTTTSTGYTSTVTASGAESMPSVSLTTGTRALILINFQYVSNSSAGDICFAGFAISGATTVAANDARSSEYESSNANDASGVTLTWLHETLTAGANVFRIHVRVSGGTGTFVRPRIIVQAF